MEKLPLSTTLETAKKHLRENYTKGVKCPCCDQFVKMYKRPITSAMAYALILFYKQYVGKELKDITIHADKFFKTQDCPPSIRGDFPKLVYWGFLRKFDHCDGWYRLTESGRDFVQGKTSAPSHRLFYNNKCFGVPEDAKLITIKDALKKKFDYEKLMNNTL